MPRVSVCFSNYNYARYCAEALDSILDQNYEDYEVIVVENGSTDESLKVLEPYQGHPRFRLVALPENRGIAGGYGEGLRQAQGELVTFLSTDDRSPRWFLSEAVAALDAHPECALSYGRVEAFGAPPEECARVSSFYRAGQLGARQFFTDLLAGNFVAITSGLMRRTRVEEVGGFDPAIRQTVDYDFLLKLASRGGGCFVDRVMLHYRVHGANASYPTLEHGFEALRDLHVTLQTMLERHGQALEAACFTDLVRQKLRRTEERLGRAYYRRREFDRAKPLLRRALAGGPVRFSMALKYINACIRSWR